MLRSRRLVAIRLPFSGPPTRGFRAVGPKADPCILTSKKPSPSTKPFSRKAARPSSATTPPKILANVVLLSEIPTTYDKKEQRQVNSGNLLLRGVPGVGKTFFGVILAAISNAKFARIQGRADLQPTEVVGFQMINPATGELITEFGSARRGRSHPARRDQPHPAQVAERVPRGPAGPHRDGRQDDLRAAGVQLRHRDDEPGRARARARSRCRKRRPIASRSW